MIEKIKTVQIVSQASRKPQMLDALRDLGIVHIAEKRSADAAALERFSRLQQTWSQLGDYRTENSESGVIKTTSRAICQFTENITPSVPRIVRIPLKSCVKPISRPSAN